MYKWNLTGTANQQRIVRAAFERIKFPFDRLTLPGTPELGWRNLNTEAFRAHGDNHHDGDVADTLEGEINGRRWVMGCIYPMSGRIYLDLRLETLPEMAHATLGAEIAHAVDFFMPMADAMRDEFMRLWGKPGTTWWEVSDYGSEYFRLGGEAFMAEFVKAYSEIDFGRNDFLHDLGVEPADVRRILGVERTDYVERFPPSLIYHKTSHYPKVGTPVTDLTGLRSCKVCKPSP